MMGRQAKLELVALVLWAFVLIRMDKDNGFRTAAQCIRWYGNRCRNLGNWAYGQAIWSDNAYREMITP